MSKHDFFKDACCHQHCCRNNTDDTSNISNFWAVLIFLIFFGTLGNDCFWNGYCNAFISSAFSCGNFNNKNILSNNTNSLFDNSNSLFNDSSSLFNND